MKWLSYIGAQGRIQSETENILSVDVGIVLIGLYLLCSHESVGMCEGSWAMWKYPWFRCIVSAFGATGRFLHFSGLSPWQR